LKQKGIIDSNEYERHFNGVIAQMEERVRSVWERIKCDHDNIEVVSANGDYGCGIIEVTWKCNDCGTVMEGQVNMEELWRYDHVARELQMNFERVI
jgi:rubrerythrin